MLLGRGLSLCLVLYLGLNTVSCYKICPEGYCRHSNGCYLVVDLKVSWIDAKMSLDTWLEKENLLKSYCKVLGGELLSISSSAMNSAAEGALRRSVGLVSPGIFWLDITDLLNPKDWRKMDTRTALTYTNWDSGNELSGNGTTNKRCVTMSEDRNYKWISEDCREKRNFVCFSTGTEKYNNPYNRYGRYDVDDDDDDQIECLPMIDMYE